MKIAERGGHNYQATGASDIINEVTEDRAVSAAVKKYLGLGGASVIDCTPGNCDVNSDLAFGVNKANSEGADIFCSFHFNSYKHTSYAMGSEVLVYNPFTEANRVLNALVGLGFKNRGVKERPGLYELRNTKMKAMIIETCFVDSEEDVRLYKQLGADTIGKAIAEAILGHAVEAPSTPSEPHTRPFEYGITTASVLNVRNAINGDIIGTLPKGATVHIDYVKDGWASIFWGDHGGWICMEYLKPKDLYGIVTAKSGLKVRDGAGTGYRQIGVLSCGEKVRIGFSSEDGKWHNIYFGDHGGWVSADYIRLL